jgi:hypothetical protein
MSRASFVTRCKRALLRFIARNLSATTKREMIEALAVNGPRVGLLIFGPDPIRATLRSPAKGLTLVRRGNDDIEIADRKIHSCKFYMTENPAVFDVEPQRPGPEVYGR